MVSEKLTNDLTVRNMSEIKLLSQCSVDERQAAFELYLNSFEYYDASYDEEEQRNLIDRLSQADWFDGLVCFESGEGRGFCFFTKCYSSFDAKMALRIEEIYVRADLRNQGIGTRLLETLTQHAERNDISRISLSTESRYRKAMNFYKGHGFLPRKGFVTLLKMIEPGR